jgi:hypothetical protein
VNGATLPIVMCPGCRAEMEVIRIEADPQPSRMSRTIYRCPACSAESERRYSRAAEVGHRRSA